MTSHRPISVKVRVGLPAGPSGWPARVPPSRGGRGPRRPDLLGARGPGQGEPQRRLGGGVEQHVCGRTAQPQAERRHLLGVRHHVQERRGAARAAALRGVRRCRAATVPPVLVLQRQLA